MKQEVKVSFYTKRNETKEDGTCPVMARLTVGATETVFSAKLTVPVGMWASGRAKGKGQTASEINRKLDEIRASAISHWRELSAIREKVTAEEVKNLILGMAYGQETLLTYFRTCNEKFDRRIGVNRSEGSAKSYRNTLNHVGRFISEKYHLSDILFSALDRSFIDKYDHHLRTECRLAQGTIVLLEELDRLMTTPLTSPFHYLIRDLFLFSCHTGVSYGDMRRLTDEDLWVADDGTVWIKSRYSTCHFKFSNAIAEQHLTDDYCRCTVTRT